MELSSGQVRRRAWSAACLGLACLMLLASARPDAQNAQNAATATGSAAPNQNASALIQKVRDNLELDNELLSQYTYLERRRDVRVSKLGKVTMGPIRTFEVYPSGKRGRTYKRLIEVDGQPLAPAELARRDEEHRQAVLAAQEREKNESPSDRAARLKKEAEDAREQKEIVDDGFNVYDIKLVGQEPGDGCQMTIAALTPRQNVDTRTEIGGYFKKFKGRAWVCQQDYQVARVEMEAIDDITIGWGLLGRVHEGSKFTFSRKKVNGEIWLPAEVRFEASGRTLLFRKFQLFTVTSYSDYKKFNVNTSVSYGDPPKEHP
jgi:hypothetical protein